MMQSLISRGESIETLLIPPKITVTICFSIPRFNLFIKAKYSLHTFVYIHKPAMESLNRRVLGLKSFVIKQLLRWH